MESDAAVDQTTEPPETELLASWKVLGAVGLGLVGFLLLVYEPALRGPLISDDFGYLTSPVLEKMSRNIFPSRFIVDYVINYGL